MVVRQFGVEQAIPLLGNIDAWCFEYDRNPGTAGKLQNMMSKWGECQMIPIQKKGGAQLSYIRWRENWVQTKVIPRNVRPTLYSKWRDALKLVGQLTQEKYQILEELANCRRDNALELWWENYRDEYLVELQAKVKELEARNKDLTRRVEEAEEKVRCKVPRQCSIKIRNMKAKMEEDMGYFKVANKKLTKLVDDLQKALGGARAKIQQLQGKVKNLEEELRRTKATCQARAAGAVEEARDEMRSQNLAEVEAIMALLDSASEERDSWKQAFEQSEQDKEDEIARRVAEAVEDVQREFEAASTTAAQQKKDEQHRAEIAAMRILVEKSDQRLSIAAGIAFKNQWLAEKAASMDYWIVQNAKLQEEKGPPTTEELKSFYADVVGLTRSFTQDVDSRIFMDLN